MADFWLFLKKIVPKKHFALDIKLTKLIKNNWILKVVNWKLLAHRLIWLQIENVLQGQTIVLECHVEAWPRWSTIYFNLFVFFVWLLCEDKKDKAGRWSISLFKTDQIKSNQTNKQIRNHLHILTGQSTIGRKTVDLLQPGLKSLHCCCLVSFLSFCQSFAFH